MSGGECAHPTGTNGVLLDDGNKNDPNYFETVDSTLFQCCEFVDYLILHVG